jgi:catechol 2,3-dioxygenase-like lactoylglutathione lyase family enzyme
VLKLRFLSHGTLESKNLDRSKQFYTEFLGLEVIRTSPFSLLIRLGGNHTIAVVEQKRSSDVMSLFNHNGLDVETQAEVDECHRIAIENAAKWDLKKIGKPSIQHGTYSFSSGIWMATAGKF